MGYTLLDHTSEIGFEATGDTLDAAFADAGRAVFEIMTDIDNLEREQAVAFTVESENLEALLFDFVDELIYISQADGLLLKSFDVSIELSNTGYRLQCTGEGQEPEDGMRLQEIKAPTYSDVLVEEQDDGWRLRMIVDV